jgi:hypothetical protein
LREKSLYIDIKANEAKTQLNIATKEKSSLDIELKDLWKEIDELITPDSIALVLGQKAMTNNVLILVYEAMALITKGKKTNGFTEAKNILVSQQRELYSRIKKFKDEISSGKVSDSVMEEFKNYLYNM